MSKTLLLFLFSDYVDPYVNAIAHSFDFMQVTAVKLIHVKGTTTGLTDLQASAVSNQIWRQIEALASGLYLNFETEDSANQVQPSSQHSLSQTTNIGIYQRINERLQDRQLVSLGHSQLKDSIAQLIAKQGGANNCLIDLTAATKVPSIDIFSVCLALGIRSVYTFELVDRAARKNPESSLYHVLKSNQFSYTCLSDTAPVRASRAALYRRSSLLWSVGIVALLLTLVSLYVLIIVGTQSLPIQILNLVAAVVGIVSPLWAFFDQHRE